MTEQFKTVSKRLPAKNQARKLQYWTQQSIEHEWSLLSKSPGDVTGLLEGSWFSTSGAATNRARHHQIWVRKKWSRQKLIILHKLLTGDSIHDFQIQIPRHMIQENIQSHLDSFVVFIAISRFLSRCAKLQCCLIHPDGKREKRPATTTSWNSLVSTSNLCRPCKKSCNVKDIWFIVRPCKKGIRTTLFE